MTACKKHCFQLIEDVIITTLSRKMKIPRPAVLAMRQVCSYLKYATLILFCHSLQYTELLRHDSYPDWNIEWFERVVKVGTS